MKKLRAFTATLFDEVNVTKLDFVLSVTIGTLAGIIVGMLVSPRKNTSIHCGNDNGNNYFGTDEDIEFFEDEL